MEMWNTDLAVAIFAVFCRAGAMMMLIPFLNKPTPVLVRIALAFFLAVFAFPIVLDGGSPGAMTHWTGLVLLLLREIVLGLLMGFAIQILFFLCQVAGRLITSEMGLMQSNIFNPMTSQTETVLGTAFSLLAIVLIFVTNIHHFFIHAFLRSFEIAPTGLHGIRAAGVDVVIRETGNIFLVGVQMAAPLIAVNFVILLTFAILGRVVPTLNVFILSFAVRLLVGFFVLGLISIVLVQYLLSEAQGIPERMLQFLPR